MSFADDEHGLHILQPFGGVEAAARRARSEGYGRLNGDVLGACLLLVDAAGEGAALIEQVCMQRDATAEERAACAAKLLERAIAEATSLGQSSIGVSALPAALSVEGATWLSVAGFSIPDEGALASRAEECGGGPARSASGVVWRDL